MKLSLVIPKLLILLFFFLHHSAFAEMAVNMGVDVKATSLGHAVTAEPPGISAVYFNPAALAKLEGRRIEMQFLSVDVNSDVKFTAPPGYEVFGFSDDPLVCARKSSATSSTCAEFKSSHAEIAGTAFYVPIVDKVVHGPTPPIGPIPLPPAISIKPPGSRFTFANMLTAPLIGGMYRDDDDPGRYLGKEMAFEVINYLNPTVGYEINEQWSVGFGVGFSYAAIAMDTEVRSPNELMAFMRILDESVCTPFKGSPNMVTDLALGGFCNAEEGLGPFKSLASVNATMEDTYTPNYTIGVHWEGSDKFAWGAVYHAGTTYQMSGPFVVEYSNAATSTLNALGGSPTGQLALGILGVPASLPDSESGTISMDFSMPAHFQTGIKYNILPSLKVNFDVSWLNTSVMKDLSMTFDRRSAGISLARMLAPGKEANSLSIKTDMADTWSWNLGLEYQLNRRISFRAGYDPRDSIVGGDKITPIGPLADAHVYSIGLGYKWDSDTDVDFGIARMISIYDAPANTACLSNCTGISNLIYNPYAGLDIESEFDVIIAGLAFRTSW